VCSTIYPNHTQYTTTTTTTTTTITTMRQEIEPFVPASQKKCVQQQQGVAPSHANRSNKSAGVILIDPWSTNIYDPSTYRVMVVQQRQSSAWGLPKGHSEKEETLLSAAHREFLEETGVLLSSLAENVDYVPLVLKECRAVTAATATATATARGATEKPTQQPVFYNNHLQIKKIHFFVYILLRRGSSLLHGSYDDSEISAVSWMNVHQWHIDLPVRYSANPQPPRFNRTLSDTSINTLIDICDKTSVWLQRKYGGGAVAAANGYASRRCVNLF
jgi:8-oxo-dGTP pyrophosphatase MutT (NUDIX family)